MTITISDKKANDNDIYENYDFDSLGSLEQSVLDHNLSKSKKEAVLLRRLTDRRRKPSKKFRHTQYDPSEYSNNPFIEDFLDHTSLVKTRLKKSSSTNFDEFDNSFDESIIDSKSAAKTITKLAADIERNNLKNIKNSETNHYNGVKLRSSASSANRRTSQFKTQSVCYISTQNGSDSQPFRKTSFRMEDINLNNNNDTMNNNHADAEVNVTSINNESQSINNNKILNQKNNEVDFNNNVLRSRSLKSPAFAVSVDQIQNEIGKLKIIEKQQQPKIFRFNATETQNTTQTKALEKPVTPPTEVSKPKSIGTTQRRSLYIDTKNNNNNTSAKVSKETPVTPSSPESNFFSSSLTQFESAPKSNPTTTKSRSNSFQRQNSANTKSQMPSVQEQVKNENTENIKPSTPKVNNQPLGLPVALTTHNLYKKTKTDEPIKTVINVTYDSSKLKQSTGNTTNNQVSNSSNVNHTTTPTPQTQNSINRVNNKSIKQSTPHTNVLTENNNKLESNNDIPSWKLELMKRKRTSNLITLINAEENRLNESLNNKTNTSSSFPPPTSNSKPTTNTNNNNSSTNNKNIITIETSDYKPQTPIISNPSSTTSFSSITLKPTFQSNTQKNTKLVHNSIGSPIALTSSTSTTTTANIHESSDIPEWKRTLLEKKKLKKVF